MEMWSCPSLPIDRSKSRQETEVLLSVVSVQQDKYVADIYQILSCLWTKHHRCTFMRNWIEMPTVSFPLGVKTVWILLHISRELCRLEDGAICSHWNTDYLLENISHKHHKNVIYQKLNLLGDVIFRVLVLAFGVRVFLHKIFFFVIQY